VNPFADIKADFDTQKVSCTFSGIQRHSSPSSDNAKSFLKGVVRAEGTIADTVQKQRFYEQQKSRDICIIRLFLFAGLALEEMVALNIDDVNIPDQTIRVFRENGREVKLIVDNETSVCLKEYMLSRRDDFEVTDDERALFVTRYANRLGRRGIENIIAKYRNALMHYDPKMTPRALRNVYINEFLKDCDNAGLLSEYMGYSKEYAKKLVNDYNKLYSTHIEEK
jgi:integrase/recombinase XerC